MSWLSHVATVVGDSLSLTVGVGIPVLILAEEVAEKIARRRQERLPVARAIREIEALRDAAIRQMREESNA